MSAIEDVGVAEAELDDVDDEAGDEVSGLADEVFIEDVGMAEGLGECGNDDHSYLREFPSRSLKHGFLFPYLRAHGVSAEMS